jgi:hypothetical protein
MMPMARRFEMVSSLIRQAASEGIRITLENNDRLMAYGPAQARARWIPILRQHKQGIVAELAQLTMQTDRERACNLNQGGAPPAAVEAIYAQMEAERERRRDWYAQPVEGWRDGRLTIRNIARDETVVVDFRKWRSGR